MFDAFAIAGCKHRASRYLKARRAKHHRRRASSRLLRLEPLERRTLLAALEGTVFFDADADGQWDSGESGESGLTLYLDQNRNARLDQGEASTATDGAGHYSFDVAPGVTYQVRLDLSSQWMQTTPGQATGPGLLGDVLEVLDSPAARPLGITSDGTSLWAVGSSPQQVYQINLATGALVSSFAPPAGSNIWDIEFDSHVGAKTVFWATDSSSDHLLRFDSTGTVLESFPAPGPDATGIAWARDALWVADKTTDLIYRVNPSTGAVMSPFQAPDGNMFGLTFDGRSLWTSGRDSLRTYAVDPDTGAIVQSFRLSTVEQPTTRGVARLTHRFL
jgi:hypothetical protein